MENKFVGKMIERECRENKLMVGGGVVSELGAWPCRVYSKGVVANSLQCTSCMNWVNSCSGVKGSL